MKRPHDVYEVGVDLKEIVSVFRLRRFDNEADADLYLDGWHAGNEGRGDGVAIPASHLEGFLCIELHRLPVGAPHPTAVAATAIKEGFWEHVEVKS